MNRQYFGDIIKITKSNYKSHSVRKELYSIHNSEIEGIERTHVLKEMNENRKMAKRIRKYPRWKALVAICRRLGSIHNLNQFPRHLLNIYAPIFFMKYPNGQIWFVKNGVFVPGALDSTIQDVLKIHRPDFASDYPFTRYGPQSYGIGFDGIIEGVGLMIPMMVRYPFVQGYFASSTGGLCIFILNKPIDIDYISAIDLRQILLADTQNVYSDSLTAPPSSKRLRLEPLAFEDFQEYLKWYLINLQNLTLFLNEIADPEDRLLVSFSIARICLDTYLIQLTEEPYPRKILFLNLIDKYANLISDLGKGQKEEQIWKQLLSLSTFDSKLSGLYSTAPACLKLAKQGRNILEGMINDMLYLKYGGPRVPVLDFEEEAVKYLRNYRNSNHGYLLNKDDKRAMLLNHSGDIPNYLPDLSLCLWHILVANPRGLIDAFSGSSEQTQ